MFTRCDLVCIRAFIDQWFALLFIIYIYDIYTGIYIYDILLYSVLISELDEWWIKLQEHLLHENCIFHDVWARNVLGGIEKITLSAGPSRPTPPSVATSLIYYLFDIREFYTWGKTQQGRRRTYTKKLPKFVVDWMTTPCILWKATQSCYYVN